MRPPSPLTYPFDTLPALGRWTTVAPGVHWLRMPLPFALDHINLWMLDDGDAIAVRPVAELAHAVGPAGVHHQILEQTR